MTDILCRWLNDEVQLSRRIDPADFAEEFSNGYLLGEVLHTHGLQDDFVSFSQSSTSDSKLNNFTRIEPTMALLGIPFDTNLAKDIMSQKPGVATRLLYQLFIALGKKAKMNLTGAAMETMRARGPAKLSDIESGLYKERLKTLVPRQVDLDFDDLIERYHRQQRDQEEKAIIKQMEDEERLQKYRQQKREEGLQRSRQIRDKQDTVMEKIKEATVKIPKPPKSKKQGKSRGGSRKSKEAQEVFESIDQFENNMKSMLPPMSPLDIDKSDVNTDIEIFLNNGSGVQLPPTTAFKPETSAEYVNKIRNKLNQDVNARKEREKRRRKVLVEQMKANEAQEEARREEMLVNRLMRQSQMERRIAVQLMQVRHEKDVIKQNRLLREQQFTERRLKDFDDALEREAEMCRQAKLEYEDELEKNRELHAAIAAERAREKYQKHFLFCKEVLSNIVDFACKVGEYRELTERSLPAKLVREWKAMLIDGQPFYTDKVAEGDETTGSAAEIEDNKEMLLDEEDFEEYQSLMGEWSQSELPDGLDPTKKNPILGHILKRIFDIVYPPEAAPDKPQFPPCPIKACILGKFFCGKTTAIQHITATHRIVSLDIESLIKEAVTAFQNNEVVEVDIATLPEDTIDAVAVVNETATDATKDPGNSTTNTTDRETVSRTDGETVPAGLGQISEGDEGRDSRDTQGDTKTGSDDLKTSEDRDVIASTSVTPQPKAAESNQSLKSTLLQPEATKRAKLGAKAFHYLKKGKQVPDAVIVDIVANAIREVPEGTGWILDNFPTTINQAKLLEKAMTGYEASPSPIKGAKVDIKKTKKSRIAPDPAPTPQPPPPQSGFDVVIHFDMEDDMILKRAEGRTYDPNTMEEFHEEFKPPPEGSYTGVLGRSEIQDVADASFDREQVQSRLTGFQDTWPRLEKWFNKFGVLAKVNVDKPRGDVFLEVENIIEETLVKINLLHQPPEEEKVLEATTPRPPLSEGVSEPKAEDAPAEAPPIPESPVPTPAEGKAGKETKGKDGKADAKKGGKKDARGGRASSPGSRKDKKDKGRERSATPTKGRTSPKGERTSSKKGSRSPSPTKGSRPGSKQGSRPGSKQGSRPGSKTGRRSKSPAKVEEPPAEEVPVVPEGPIPGSAEWEYVDKTVDAEVAQYLVPKWETVESNYIDTSKGIFRSIRQEREKIIRYFHNTRKSYVEFLTRPDTKQEFVEHWQKEYNEIEEDLREDEDARAEIHERVEDLCVRLWDICDTRKEEAESERQRIMTEKWLEDRTGLLINHYLSLMQAEVDRYQDSCSLIKDYYVSMEDMNGSQRSKLLAAINMEILRLPLVELPPTNLKPKESEASLVETKPLSAKGSREKDRNKEVKTPENVEVDEENKKRIPLVQRRPKSSESPGKEKKEKKTTPRKDKGDDKAESPLPLPDPDEKLLHDAQQVAYQAIETQIALSMADDPAGLPKVPEEKEKDLQKTASKGKKDKKQGGRKSAGKSTSKGQLIETPMPAKEELPDTQSEEELKKKVIKEKALKEYRGAVQIESDRLRARIDLIKAIATTVNADLKEKADITYADMDDWLGKRFLEEMESIDAMATLMRVAIENQQQLQDALVLKDKDFIVEIDFHTYKTPSPPPPPSPVETAYSDAFTVIQLHAIFEQLLRTAPSGVISVRAFCDTFQDLAACTEGSEILPDCWMSITPQQLQEISNLLSWDQENIDWRAFLVAAAQPYPMIANQQLLYLLATFHSLDAERCGFISEDDYLQVPLFPTDVRSSSDADNADNNNYDRFGNLEQFLFDVFSQQVGEELLLDYKLMLQYLSVHPNPLDGFFRALSISTNKIMPTSSEIEVKVEDNVDGTVWKDQVPAEMLTEIYLDELLQVFNLSQQRTEDSHRFATSKEFLSLMSKDQLAGIYCELGAADDECVPLYLLYQHPVMKEYINACHKYKLIDPRDIFKQVEETTE